jgi:predicted phosphodiesterase
MKSLDEDFRIQDTLVRLPINPTLKNWATERQCEAIDAVNKYGTRLAAGAALGITERAVFGLLQSAKIAACNALGITLPELNDAIEALSKKAALTGHAPDFDMTKRVPRPYRVKGVTTQYDSTGSVTQQWVKSELDREEADKAIEEWVHWLTKRAKSKSPLIKPPKNFDEDLMCVYPMGDPHFGMHAWAREAGEDFSLHTAELVTITAIDRLVASAPNAKIGVILNLGDFFHTDNEENRTERSNNSLDVSGRWTEIMQVGLRAMIWCIERALEKHETVIVRNVRGNHDKRSSYALALSLDMYYKNNPRVHISLSPAAFWYFQFGKVLIGATHGDTTKPANLPGIMYTDCRSLISSSEFLYFYQGHLHHDKVEEKDGVTCEIFRTLAGSDAWHFSSGYRSGQDMRCIVHHKEYGEIERHRCDIKMIRDSAPPKVIAAAAAIAQDHDPKHSMIFKL